MFATRPQPGRLVLKCSQFGTATPWLLRCQRGDDGFVAGVYEGVAVGDDGLAVALEHHDDKRVLALRHVAQAQPCQATVGCHGDLAQRNLGTFFKRRRGHNQKVAFFNYGIAVGQHGVRAVAQHQDHEHVRRAANIGERASGKRMARAHLELDKRHAVLVA